MALTTNEREALNALFQRHESAIRAVLGGITKAELLQAVVDIDAWIDNNVSSFNSAISEPARTVLTSKQKYWLFQRIVDAKRESV